MKVDNELMIKIWRKYIQMKETNKQRAEMYAVKEGKQFINLCLRKFKVRPEYWDEFYSYLLLDYFRALDSYTESKQVKIFGWVWRLCSQCAWRFIRDKQKLIEKEKMFVELIDNASI